MEIMHGGGKISLSINRLCAMDVTLSVALEMCENPYQIISYLLNGERMDLKSKCQNLIGDMRS